MFKSFIALFTLFFALIQASLAALITSHSDTTALGATLDGVISPNEYGPGNSFAYSGGGSGFGGQFGNATLYLKSDSDFLYIAFANLGVPDDGNQYILYLNTRPGGFQPNSIDMDDTSDGGRANASRLSLDGTESVTFDDGLTTANPDFALVFYNNSGGFSALFELAGAGNFHDLIDHDLAGLGTSVVEFRVPLASLGLIGGGTVEFAGFNISNTGWLSNEGIPNLGLGANPEYAAGATNIFADFHRFETLQVGPQVGFTKRVPNITLTMPLTPPVETLGSFVIEDAFALSFNTPMCIRTPPGETNRLFVAERAGILVVVTNLANPTRTTYLNMTSIVNPDGEGGLLGFAFHPDYANNGYLYVNYATTTTTPLGSGFHIRLSRFQVSPGNPNFVDPATQVVLITQFHRANNHNGGDVHFGPDGYLYVSLGDEGQSNDNFNNGQRIDGGFFASIIRIDVDKQPGSLAPNPHPAINGPTTNFAIPPDNPFIGATSFNGASVNPANVRTEIFAIGLRNPWRIAFDDVTGELYVADVGQGAREEVNLITSGGNYGWKWREGKIATPGIGTPPPGFTTWINPLLDYTHGSNTNQGRSITGGVVYRGERFPSLFGSYLFADYISGNLWALTHDGTNATSFPRLTGVVNPITFGVDPRNGDVLIGRLANAPLSRLTQSAGGSGFPGTLADTGVFYDRQTLTPFAGILPYDLNVPFWSDNSIKSRWFSIPDTNLVIQFSPDQPWTFPDGTVWIKHFDLELVRGDPASTRRLETRILVKNDSAEGGYGVTYRWGTSTNNAVLIPAEGLNESFVIDDYSLIRTQVWRYPSRTECLTCHQPAAGFALGFNTPQLNRPFDYNGVPTNQLAALSCANYFDQCIDTPHLLRQLAHATNELFSLEYRVRSYLQANCVQCHAPGLPAPFTFDTRIFTSLPDTSLIDGLLNNNQGNPDNRIVARGDLPLSMLHSRIATLGGTRMPPLASSVLDTENIALVAAWITTESTNYQTYAEWQIAYFGSTDDPNAQPGEDPDDDGNINRLEYLTRTDPLDPLDPWSPTLQAGPDGPVLAFQQPARIGVDIQITTNLVDPTWTSWNDLANAPVFRPTDTWVEQTLPGEIENERYFRFQFYEP